MEQKFYSFPKIGQFVDTIRNIKHRSDYRGLDAEGSPIYNHEQPYPQLAYQGTVKIHGTNSGLIFVDNTGAFQCQSRERIITPQSDNAGFAAFIYALPKEIKEILFEPYHALYGEWCGGNIQGGVAIHGLPKMWIIFAKKSCIDLTETEQHWGNTKISTADLIILNNHQIYFSWQFPTYEIVIDFAYPEIAQNKLVELTETVEKECPVGKFFDKEGVGEGIIWKPLDPNYQNSGYWFKVKGEKHASSKHKTLAPVDMEVVKQIQELVDIVVTDNRVEQGITKLKEAGKEVSVKNMGDFLKWINGDIEAEEAELLDKSGIERKKIHGKISNKAKDLFLTKIGKGV